MTELQLSDADNGKVLDASVGDVIELRLNELASGGYRWSAATAPSDILEPLEPQYEFKEGTVGGRSVAHFRFRINGPGRSAIRLEYKRAWEAAEQPLQTYEVTIVAK